MASGDAQRVWFPEMLEEFAGAWSRSMGWPEFASLCVRIFERRRALRLARGIKPPRMKCPRCGAESTSDISGISIRSALFALKDGGVITDAEFSALDKSWQKYRRANRLDARGNAASGSARHDDAKTHHRCKS